MPKGPLRNAIEDLMLTNPATVAGKSWWDQVKARFEEAHKLFEQYVKVAPTNANITANSFLLQSTLYALTGNEFFIAAVRAKVATGFPTSLTDELQNVLRSIFSQPDTAEFARIFGVTLTEPLNALIRQYAGKDMDDPLPMLQALLGFNSAVIFTSNLVGLAIEAASGGVIRGVNEAIREAFEVHGTRRLAELVIEPVVNGSLRPNLDRYFNRTFRPRRFTASDLRDLFALGRATREDVQKGAADEGWRDQDIDQWLALAYRKLTQGDIFELYHKDQLTKEEAVARLRELGYEPGDIPYLFTLNPAKDANAERETSASTARTAYREHLIGKDELTAFLKALRYADAEVSLIIAIEDHKTAQAAKSLTLSQIKDAWKNNILSEAEARHWLEEEGFDGQTRDVIVSTWKAAEAPRFLKLNKGTVIAAYVEGILNRTEAANKLTSIGLAPDDARLELDLAEARNPGSFGHPATRKAKELTPATLSDLLAAGLITADEMLARLKSLGFSDADAGLLRDAAVERHKKAPLLLGVSMIQRAYLAGVLDRTQAKDRLLAIDFTPEDAELTLTTIEREHPDVFHPELVTRVRQPSISALVQAVKDEIIDTDTFFNKAGDLGFAPADAAIYLQIALTQAPVSTKTLSSAQVVNAYGKGIFSRGLAQGKLTAQGYSDYDAGVLLRLEKPSVAESDLFTAILQGQLDWPTGIANLLAAHYTVDDVKAAFTATDPATLAGLGINLEDILAYLAEIGPFFTPII